MLDDRDILIVDEDEDYIDYEEKYGKGGFEKISSSSEGKLKTGSKKKSSHRRNIDDDFGRPD